MRVVLLVTLVLLAPGVARAAAPPKLVVDSTSGLPDAGRPALFHGTLRADGARIKRVAECRKVSCAHYQLKIQLPHDIWEHRTGGVHVALRFIDGTPDDNLQLAVYQGHHRLGASTATVGTAQSVLLDAAKNGTYDVYVIDGIAFGLPAPSP